MDLLIALIVAPLTLLTFCFGIELLVGIRPLRRKTVPRSTASGVIIVPAHDEQSIIGDRLGSLIEAARERAKILVVADNCTDSTAAIVRSLRVEVIERNDPSRPGKGFALDFAREHLEARPPDVVLIIDADCVTDGESISSLIASCAATGLPCQATNIQLPAPDSSPAVQLSTFAFFIKNVIRQRALQRIAGRAQLLGTGMAFPWSIFARAELATGHIVEDLKLGQELAAIGHPPQLIEGATIWSDAETDTNTLSQRRRWEGGFLQNAIRVAPGILLRSIARGDARSMWAAINLMIPPVALLVLLDLLLGIGGVILWVVGAKPWPLFILAGVLAFAGLALALAWRTGGSRFVNWQGLARFPLYLVWKLPLYLGLVSRGAPKQWTRTGRSDERDGVAKTAMELGGEREGD
jgi:cellulose synthase/poly-beta-1,6-N-acetylglucosamine synthase-like glycosyltransferase